MQKLRNSIVLNVVYIGLSEFANIIGISYINSRGSEKYAKIQAATILLIASATLGNFQATFEWMDLWPTNSEYT